MDAFEIGDLAQEREQSGERYLEFQKLPGLSTGIYHLPAESVDTQQPHTEDEVYYVIAGKGAIQVADEDRLAASCSSSDTSITDSTRLRRT